LRGLRPNNLVLLVAAVGIGHALRVCDALVKSLHEALEEFCGECVEGLFVRDQVVERVRELNKGLFVVGGELKVLNDRCVF
jgi:hypothetical protein